MEYHKKTYLYKFLAERGYSVPKKSEMVKVCSLLFLIVIF